MDRHGNQTRNSMTTYHFTVPGSRKVWKSVEQNTFLSLLALEVFVCCPDEIWHQSEDGDHRNICPPNYFSLKRRLLFPKMHCLIWGWALWRIQSKLISPASNIRNLLLWKFSVLPLTWSRCTNTNPHWGFIVPPCEMVLCWCWFYLSAQAKRGWTGLSIKVSSPPQTSILISPPSGPISS